MQIPDRALRAHDAEEGDQHALQIVPLGEASRSGALVTSPSSLSLAKAGLSDSLKRIHTEIDQQHDRDQERDPPAPVEEAVLAERGAGAEDDQQAGDQAERGGDLDPAGRRAAAVVGRVLGDVDRRAAIFAAERDALEMRSRMSRIGEMMPAVA